MLPHVLIVSKAVLHMQVLWQRQLQRPQLAAGGTVSSKGGPDMATKFGLGGIIFLLCSPVGPLLRGIVHGVTA